LVTYAVFLTYEQLCFDKLTEGEHGAKTCVLKCEVSESYKTLEYHYQNEF